MALLFTRAVNGHGKWHGLVELSGKPAARAHCRGAALSGACCCPPRPVQAGISPVTLRGHDFHGEWGGCRPVRRVIAELDRQFHTCGQGAPDRNVGCRLWLLVVDQPGLLTATQFAHDGVSACGCGVPCRARIGVLIRAMAPSRESRLTPDWRSSAETGCRAASAPRRFAPAVRIGLPSTDPSARTSRPWANPERVHADVVAAPEVIHSSAART